MKSHQHFLFFALLLSLAASAGQVQAQYDDDSDGDSQFDDDNDNGVDEDEDEGEGAPQTEGDGFVTTTDYSDEDPAQPEQPLRDVDSVDVAEDAGVGSELAYASQSVLELGGTLAFFHQSNTTQFSLSPFIGYFIIDGLQLSLIAQLNILHINGDGDADSSTDVFVTALAEPSYHLALTKSLYAFLGLGFGGAFARDPKADFIFRPRIGVDILVGRSAIFKPAFYTNIGAADGFSGVGIEGSFSAMW